MGEFQWSHLKLKLNKVNPGKKIIQCDRTLSDDPQYRILRENGPFEWKSTLWLLNLKHLHICHSKSWNSPDTKITDRPVFIAVSKEHTGLFHYGQKMAIGFSFFLFFCLFLSFFFSFRILYRGKAQFMAPAYDLTSLARWPNRTWNHRISGQYSLATAVSPITWLQSQ